MKQLISLTTLWILGILNLSAMPDSEIDFANGKKIIWTSKDHPKAKGINMKISYPSSWKAEEGTRPNILQKFSIMTETEMEMMALTTRTLAAPYDKNLTDEQKNELLAKDIVAEMLPEDAKLLSHKITKIDGELCAMAEFFCVTERVGIKVAQKGMFFIIPRPGALLLIQCATGGEASKGLDGLNARYDSVKNLFILIGASCVFVDKWEE